MKRVIIALAILAALTGPASAYHQDDLQIKWMRSGKHPMGSYSSQQPPYYDTLGACLKSIWQEIEDYGWDKQPRDHRSNPVVWSLYSRIGCEKVVYRDGKVTYVGGSKAK